MSDVSYEVLLDVGEMALVREGLDQLLDTYLQMEHKEQVAKCKALIKYLDGVVADA